MNTEEKTKKGHGYILVYIAVLLAALTTWYCYKNDLRPKEALVLLKVNGRTALTVRPCNNNKDWWAISTTDGPTIVVDKETFYYGNEELVREESMSVSALLGFYEGFKTDVNDTFWFEETDENTYQMRFNAQELVTLLTLPDKLEEALLFWAKLTTSKY